MQAPTNVLVVVVLFLCLFLRPKAGYKFKDLSYEDIVSQSTALAGKFAVVRTARDMFGGDYLVKEGGLECSPIIIRVGANASNSQLLISGEIHGDERVGPASSLVTAQLLVWSAGCRVLQSASDCQRLAASFPGLTEADFDWLAYLATHRDIVIVPTLNCLGYMQNRRTERGVDPNRDFSYNRRDKKCFLSATSRTLWQLMSTHFIELVITFHAGMEAIGYEWGSRNHAAPHDRSPDDVANEGLARIFSQAAGSFSHVPPYASGRMNSIVYPVDGGMEDWLYAAGWDHAADRHDCSGWAETPRQEPDNRALVFLVETSNDKKPPEALLGESEAILNTRSAYNGHVPRNVRLSLLAADMQLPYLCWQERSLFTADDRRRDRERKQRKPRAFRGLSTDSLAANASSREIPSVHHNRGGGGTRPGEMVLRMAWYVGGAQSVNATFLTLQRDSDVVLSDDQISRLLEKRDPHNMKEDVFLASAIHSGGSRWENLGTSTAPVSLSRAGRVFHHHMRIALLPGDGEGWTAHLLMGEKGVKLAPGRYVIHARAMVDLDYSLASRGHPAGLPPQSHFVHEREKKMFWSSGSLLLLLHSNGSLSLGGAHLHCVDWRAEQSQLLQASLQDENSTMSGMSAMSAFEAIEDRGMDHEVQQSYTFLLLERSYVLAFLLFIALSVAASFLLEHWRRQRVYSSVSSNRYLSLPTGFSPPVFV